MSVSLKYRAMKVLRALPDIYLVQPETDYQALISHSSGEVTLKAWERTGKQMRLAMQYFEERSPDVRRKLAKPA